MKLHYLRTIREAKGWTQAQLALLSHVAQNTISRLETDPTAQPAFATVAALAGALRIDPRTLRFGPEPPTPKTRRSVAA